MTLFLSLLVLMLRSLHFVGSPKCFLVSQSNKVFPGSSDGKESACNVEDPGSNPELERSPGEGKDYPLQYSCLENSMHRGAWWATVHGIAESDMTERLTTLNTTCLRTSVCVSRALVRHRKVP